MSNLSSRWSLLTASLFCIAVIAVPRIAVAQGQRCPDGDEDVVRVEIEILYDSGDVSVQPSSVVVFLEEEPGRPSRVCWVVGNLQDGHRLHLGDKEEGSPDYFPYLKRVIAGRNAYANSGNPSTTGTWRYSVTVKAADGSTVAEKDPEVIVKGKV